MVVLNVMEVRKLVAQGRDVSLSMYVPTRDGRAEERAHWSSALAEARKQLSSIRGVDVASFLAPLEALAHARPSDARFAGVGVFRSQSATVHFDLVGPVADTVVVARNYQLRPLLAQLGSNTRYLLLDLTHDRTSLFEGDAFGLKPLELAGLPTSLADAVGTEHASSVVSARSGGSKGGSVWHGQGKDERTREEDELKLVRHVDHALNEALRNDATPLIVAGTGKLLSLFQRQCRHPRLVGQAIHGSFANAKLDVLHEKAAPILRDHVRKSIDEAIELHQRSGSSDRATDEITTVARAAAQGRIRTLFVARSSHAWGRLDERQGTVRMDGHVAGEAKEDVLDGLVELVLRRGGDVLVLDEERMPTRSPVAATMR